MSKDGEGCGGLIALGLLGLAIYSCSGHKEAARGASQEAVVAGVAPEPSTLDGAVATVNPVRESFNEDRAHDAASNYLSGETYEGSVGSAQCTDDCSGHEAGWQWAKDGNSCGGGESESFDQGCEAYETTISDRVEDARRRYDAGDDTFAGDE